MTRLDAAEWAGFALLVFGIGLWSIPAALVVAGFILIVWANVRAYAASRRPR